MEERNIDARHNDAGDEEIDLLELAGRLWARRKLIVKALAIGVAVGLAVAFSIPKEYGVTVTLSPESGKSGAGSLGAAASMLGLGNLSGDDADALNIALFPDILDSNPFTLELYTMEVTPADGEPLPLNEYVESQRVAWWTWLMRLPMKAVGGAVSLFSKESEDDEEVLNPFMLTKEQTRRLTAIKESMSASVDKKTGVATITVTMQDPVVSATVADSVVAKLQSYITAYRTRKAVDDFEFQEQLYRERRNEYYEAQQRYATYVDGNKSLYTQKSMLEGERLQNDMNLAYQTYNQAALQLQMTRAKIQEAKPVFAVVNPPTVPIKATSPKKMLILVGFAFMACVMAAAWVLFGQSLWASVRASAGEAERQQRTDEQ